MIVRSRLPVSRPVALAIFGMIVGLTATLGISSFSSLPARCVSERRAHDSNGLVLIGIMTAAKYVDTRAYNVWKTWAQHIPGKVLFFVAEGTESIHPDLPLVRLKGVDDTYPPQKKSFAMVRWMYDNHIDNFDWFLRADDDLYVRGGELEKFLRSLDPLKAHQIGQAGFGNSAEYGLLGLGNRDNYCMGGPGVVMSKHTLRKVAPHLEGCVGHLLTTHEDVELGRCIQKHAGVACTWNYEMQKLFHNNQTVAKAYMDNDDELKAAITLHPIKDPAMMRRLHWRNRALELKKLRSQREQLRTELSTARPSGLIWRQPNKTQHLTPWDFINNNKILFCADRVNCPRHTVDASIRREMNEIIEQLFDEFNENARVRGRVLQFQSLQYGYMRVEPQHGVHYVMDMILWFKKFRPPHRATLSVRRHAYVQQTFGPVKAIGDPAYRRKQQLSNGSNRTEHTHLYMVMALRGRAEIFARFAGHLKNVCGGNADTTLVLVLYDSDDVASIRATASDLAATSSVRVNIINMGSEKFSRGVALMKGASTLPKDALIFMTDVDMLFTCDTLQRIRLNTILNAQVYFPIVFSEFSPESWSENDRLLADAFHYGRRRGYFRHFGYGLASMYRADLDSVGGFDTNIKGWGMEDVDLFEKVVRSKLRVLRAPEPGLVHIYHPIHCAADLPPAQKSMCRGSKAASLSSIDALYDQIAHYT